MPKHFSSDISQAVFYTLLYSDVFDFPLTAREIHRYLSGIQATYEEVLHTLNADSRVIKKDHFYALIGREELVDVRIQRESHSKKLLPFALKYGRLLGFLPFVRMVALTGSLAVMNVSRIADFDYMIVTRPGRLWTARAFILLFNRLTRRLGHTICPNLIVDENSLAWNQHDLYSARELCQMIPVSGMGMYLRLMKTNEWIKDFLPNAFLESGGPPPKLQDRAPLFQRLLEFLLSGKLGDQFERWEMNRKIARFSKQAGFGEETIFNANICQGNFEHHHKWTREELERKAKEFSVSASLPGDEGIGIRA